MPIFMDACATELVALILEHACSADLGDTARALGLVSKYFRAIAKPFEFRALVIAGPKQLDATLSRLERARPALTESGSGKAEIDVRHLFVCELKSEHALAADTYFEGRGYTAGSFWRTDEGLEAESYYLDHGGDFWRSVAAFLRRVSPTLKTLTLQASTRFLWDGPLHEGILGALSGVDFPCLESLTVKHNVNSEVKYLKQANFPFIFPTAPALQRLHIISPLFITAKIGKMEQPMRLHPLLVDMHYRFGALTHLDLCDGQISDADVLMQIVCGSPDNLAGDTADRTLPGKLVSAVLRQGPSPVFFCGTGHAQYHQRKRYLVDSVKALRIGGLEAYLPTPSYPEEGKKEYELLLADWKEQALELDDALPL